MKKTDSQFLRIGLFAVNCELSNLIPVHLIPLQPAKLDDFRHNQDHDSGDDRYQPTVREVRTGGVEDVLHEW